MSGFTVIKGVSIRSSHVLTATVISKGSCSKMIGGFTWYNSGTLTSCTSTEKKILVPTTKNCNHYDCSRDTFQHDIEFFCL